MGNPNMDSLGTEELSDTKPTEDTFPFLYRKQRTDNGSLTHLSNMKGRMELGQIYSKKVA